MEQVEGRLGEGRKGGRKRKRGKKREGAKRILTPTDLVF